MTKYVLIMLAPESDELVYKTGSYRCLCDDLMKQWQCGLDIDKSLKI
jgi:hypothetical protein